MSDKTNKNSWKSGDNPELNERIEQGLKVMEKLFGGLPPEAPEANTFTDIVMAEAYADIWSRPQLSLRERSIVTVTSLAMQGGGDELRIHLRGLANQGVTREEALEIMLHLSIYAGWPTALHARRVVEEMYDIIEDK